MLLLQSGAGGFSEIIAGTWPLLLIVAVFYFFILRPQSKKQKAQQAFLDDLNKGDEVVTSSGIHGRINKIEDNVVTLQVDTKTFLKFSKQAISKEMTDEISKAEST